MKTTLLLLTACIAGFATTAQNTTTNTGAAPVYNSNFNNGSNSLNNANGSAQPATGSQNNVNTSYRSHYQPSTTNKPATITPQTPAATPNSSVPGPPTNTTPLPISK